MPRGLLDVLFVPHCVACDARLTGSGPFCVSCAGSLYELGPACPRCANPASGPVAVLCARCRATPPPFAAANAPYRYGGELAVALRRLKYERRPDIARALGPLLAPALRRAAAGADVAVPVPLHWRRTWARGFNQAAALLRHAGRDVPIAVDALCVRRRRATAAQSGLTARDRVANVAGAFLVTRRGAARLRGKRVLLVDDVMTTGATVAACARALLDGSAREVLVFCAARAEA